MKIEESGVETSKSLIGKRVFTAPARLNLGCGLHVAPGWLNVDKSLGPWLTRHRLLKQCLHILGVLSDAQYQTVWPSDIVRLRISRTLPWAKDSFQVIYSSHFLEHLPRDTAALLLKECFRILAPGGVIRLALPDLEAAAHMYLQLKEQGMPDAANRFMQTLYLNPQLEGRSLHRLTMRLVHQPHRWMYDFDSMCRTMTQTAFAQVVRREFREGDCPDLHHIETREESLFIEARKL